MRKHYPGIMLLIVLMLALAIPAGAQGVTPAVTVSDQVSLDGTVLIASAVSDGPGFVVIHADNGEGAPGPVIGHAALNPGENFRIKVAVDAAQTTPMLFAMLHTDTGEAGVYEFGMVEGADGPVSDSAGNVITPPFNVDMIYAHDQLLGDGNTVTIAGVVAQVDGWLVVHQSVDGAPGPVAGVAQVSAGNNADVVVTLDRNDPTVVLYPMLHVDTGATGEYEFGTVDGVDGPVNVNGTIAVMPIWTIPHMRVADQIVVHGDGMTMMEDMAPTLVAQSVLAAEDGWLVVHQDSGGAPGPVAGFTQVSAGTNLNVEVALDMNDPTAVLWPMLHVDTGVAGEYEFGTVEGADGPVRVEDNVVTFPIDAAPSITYEGGLEGNVLTVNQALIDAPGWLAIHASADGAPGPVIGNAPLRPGVNTLVAVTVDPAAADSQVFPMLHYDTNNNGVYEFGAVEGADGPVRVGEAVVVGPLALEAATDAGESMEEPMEAMVSCMVSSGGAVNLRTGPGTNFDVAGTLAAGQALTATGQAQGTDGFVWWQLESGQWVRSDVVTEDGDCENLPVVEAPAAPAPAATEEATG